MSCVRIEAHRVSDAVNILSPQPACNPLPAIGSIEFLSRIIHLRHCLVVQVLRMVRLRKEEPALCQQSEILHNEGSQQQHG